jgi:hypothetical protein
MLIPALRVYREPGSHRASGKAALQVPRTSWVIAGWLVAMLHASALAQYPPPRISDLNERSGLLMRFAGTKEQLPPDPFRDNFYNTRFADRGLIKHPDGIKDQGLYGLGWKANCTQSVYPFFFGSTGTSQVDPSCLPWHRSLRVFQGWTHPFRPVGMYYSMGSYVPIYDLDPIASGPGPYPYPFYFNWWKGG